MTTGERIKNARKEKKLTQEQLGKKLGISGAMVSQFENSKTPPKIQTLKKIAFALDISPLSLMVDIKSIESECGKDSYIDIGLLEIELAKKIAEEISFRN